MNLLWCRIFPYKDLLLSNPWCLDISRYVKHGLPMCRLHAQRQKVLNGTLQYYIDLYRKFYGCSRTDTLIHMQHYILLVRPHLEHAIACPVRASYVAENINTRKWNVAYDDLISLNYHNLKGEGWNLCGGSINFKTVATQSLVFFLEDVVKLIGRKHLSLAIPRHFILFISTNLDLTLTHVVFGILSSRGTIPKSGTTSILNPSLTTCFPWETLRHTVVCQQFKLYFHRTIICYLPYARIRY